MGTIIPYIMENKKIQTTNQYCLSQREWDLSNQHGDFNGI
jgi:hypothetical protein